MKIYENWQDIICLIENILYFTDVKLINVR